MRLTKQRLLLAVAVVVGLVLAVGSWRTKGPHWEDRSLDYWLDQLDLNTGLFSAIPVTPKEEAAFRALRGMGTNCLPVLLQRLDTPRLSLWDRSVEHVEEAMSKGSIRYPWPQTRERTARSRRAAIRGFHALGELARPALPDLRQRLLSTNRIHNFFAAQAIAGVGADGVQELLAATTNASPRIRGCAVFGLSFAMTNRAEAFKAVSAGARDPDSGVRQRATVALVPFNDTPAETVALLAHLLSDSDVQVRLKALYALEFFKGDIRAAAPAINAMATDPDPQIRFRVAQLQPKIKPPSPIPVP